MKMFGHPVHMMLVHFPAALIPMDLVCSFIAWKTGDRSFVDASFYAMSGAAAVGWLALLAGAFDLIGMAERHPAAVAKALIHGGINGAVIASYTVLAFVAYNHYPDLNPNGM